MNADVPATAIVLTAGLGTRLRPLSHVRAKGAMPVAGQAVVRRILSWLAHSGVSTAVLNLHHRPESITAAVGDGADLGLSIKYSWEPRILGSAGGPRRALGLVDDERVWVVNGDTLTDVDLAALARTHAGSSAKVTMAVVPHPAPQQYGGVAVDDEGWITGFPHRGQHRTARHFIGVQLVERDVFDALPDGERAESVSAVYPALMARDGRTIRAFACDASFMDIGTMRDYLSTSLALAGSAPEGALQGARTVVAAGAQLDRTVLWDDVVVESDVRLRQCVVADGVCVPRGLKMDRVALVRADQVPADVRGARLGGVVIEPIA